MIARVGTKVAAVIAFLFALAGCPEAPGPHTAPVATSLVASQPPITQLKVVQHAGYSTEERRKLDDALQVATAVLNSPDFQRAVLAYGTGRNPPGFSQAERAFPERAVASNQEVLDALLSGNVPADRTIRLFLSMEKKRSEVGHTLPTPGQDSVTYTDREHFARMGSAEIAEHLIHEHLHRIGFLHHSGYSVERCDSIPYAVGRLVCTVAKGQFNATGSCEIAPNGKC
jgi:hypothetical protein